MHRVFDILKMENVMERLSISILVLMSLFAFGCKAQKVDNSTVSSLDPERFLGKWYEIARYDHVFERGLEFASAEYTQMDDCSKLKVVNRGVKDGRLKTSTGKAKFTDTPGLLRVSFFGPFYSDYRVMMLADDYGYALIGSSSGKHLWILSRTKELPSTVENMILDEAMSRGYDTDELIWVKQSLYSEN